MTTESWPPARHWDSGASEELDRTAGVDGPESCPESASLARRRPLPRLNDENSPAKFQNVREDSCAGRDALRSGLAGHQPSCSLCLRLAGEVSLNDVRGNALKIGTDDIRFGS
jgi:hypothetical protein